MTGRVSVSPWARLIRIRELAATEPAVDPSVRQKVDSLWHQALGRSVGLVDGDLFCLVGEARPACPEIAGRFIKYRYHVAQRMDPSLETLLSVRPLAVTALVRCPEGLLFAERGRTATQDAGSWELVPAGGLEPDSRVPGGTVDPRRQLLKEMSEETGVRGIGIRQFRPVFWMQEGSVTDLVFTLKLPMSGAQLQERFAALSSAEHRAIRVIPEDRLREELARQGRVFSASTRALCEAWLSSGRMSR